MIRIAVIGYGNIGKFAVETVKGSPDMELAGIVRRNAADKQENNIPIVDDIGKLDNVDVALLCAPTRSIEELAIKYLKAGYHTVDSFDIHGQIPALRQTLDEAARSSGKVAMLSAGWDPGSDSVVRALMEACAPKGITYTNFGPGMSMGHTVAAKSKKGVANAISMTIPAGAGVHKRVVYVQLEEGASFDEVSASIKADPYFAYDETHVIAVDDADAYIDRGHGVKMVRKGVSGVTDNQNFSFGMSINNPALTAQVMVCCARAAMRQNPGCYTMIEIPPVDLLPGDRQKWIAKLV